MPGISGGTLCVAFGMYEPLLHIFSHPRKAIRKDGLKLLFFLLGVGIGFFGLAGLAGWLMAKNSQAVTCVFIGFIIGTIPELWRDAGKEGRPGSSFISLFAGFALLLGILLLLRYSGSITVAPNIWGFLLCGLLWGISFIFPGLSSSTLLIFFGLYQPMLEGIAALSMPVLIPLAIGVGICLLILPRAVHMAYQKWYSQISHAIIGIVAASMLSVIPVAMLQSFSGILTAIAYIVCGAVVSYLVSKLCARLTDQTNR